MRSVMMLLWASTVLAQPATQPNAAPLYEQAAALLKTDCPASSALEFGSWYPPADPAWLERAQAADRDNAPARALVRQARSADALGWAERPKPPLKRYTPLRSLANECGDAALLAHHRGNDAEAIDLVRDVLHIARLLDQEPNSGDVGNLVAIGIDAIACDRLMIVSSDLHLDANGPSRVTLQAVIADLLARRDRPLLELLVREDPKHGGRAAEVIRRGDTERALAAMSLALDLYRADHGAWPASSAHLAPQYLPALPLDPWIVNHTLGYALIKGGLPDGGDRPLVFSRCLAEDGLRYRTDEPQFGFYTSDGSTNPQVKQLQCGQFRDVVRWTPKPVIRSERPTLIPLPADAIR